MEEEHSSSKRLMMEERKDKRDELEIQFERYGFEVEDEEIAARRACDCCPVPHGACGKFLVGCFLPISCICWKPYSSATSKGGVMLFLFLGVILLGALFFWGVEGYNECQEAGLPFPQGIRVWSYGSSVYFMVITLTTIGYGDMSPSTTGGKVFLIFFGSLGLAVVAAALGYFTSVLVEALQSTNGYVGPFLVRRGLHPRVARFIQSWRLALILSCVYLILLVIGALLFGWAEPFSPPKFLNGLYFSFITLTTIGYGDLLPTHAGTRFWAVLYSLIGVGLFGFIIGNISNSFTEVARMERKKRRRSQLRDPDDIVSADLRLILSGIDAAFESMRSRGPKEQELIRKYVKRRYIYEIYSSNDAE